MFVEIEVARDTPWRSIVAKEIEVYDEARGLILLPLPLYDVNGVKL